MSGGPIGGQGPLWKRAIWVFIACCITIAIWNSFSHDPKGFRADLERKSDQLRGVASRIVNAIDLGINTNNTPQNNKPNNKPNKTGHQPNKPHTNH